MPVALLSCWPRGGPTQHSHFYLLGRGVARPRILTSIVLAAEWPDPALSLPPCWPRKMARPSILTFIVLAAEWADPAFSPLSRWPQNGPTHHSHGKHRTVKSRIHHDRNENDDSDHSATTAIKVKTLDRATPQSPR